MKQFPPGDAPVGRGLYTLRFRLAALNLLVFGLIVIVLAIITFQIIKAFLRQEHDAWLREVAENMMTEIVMISEMDTTRNSDQSPRLNPFHFPGFYFQVRALDGRILDRSGNLDDMTLPLSDRAATARESGSAVLETLVGEVPDALLGPGEQMRLLSIYHHDRIRAPYCLQIGVSLARVNNSIARVSRTFLVVVPISLLVVGLFSWIMARRSLAPIGKVVRAARELSVADFDRRIPPPSGRDEVAEMIRTINGMLDRLQAGFRSHERFIADAAHELKTPVAVLLGESQVLSRQARTPEEYDHFVGSVENEMRRLSQIIDSLLILARANAGFPISLAHPVSLNDVVSEAVQRCSALARQKEVHLVPQLWLPGPDQPEPLIRGDEDLLCSMVGNLIRNAVRVSEAGTAVELELTVTDGTAVIAVRDRGPGIPPELLGRVFEEFFRIPQRDMTAGGVGLGLSIVSGVARLHGGTVTASNRASGGCEFVVRLPLTLPDE